MRVPTHRNSQNKVMRGDTHHGVGQADDPNYVIVHLEFDTLDAAKNLLTSLQQLWKQVEGKVMTGPKTRIIEIAESKEY